MDEHQLRVRDADRIVKGYRADFLSHPPIPAHPRDLGALAQNARLSIVAYATAVEGKLNPRARAEGGALALHFTVHTAMMGQTLESWLIADHAQHGNFSMGLANIELKRGRAQIASTNVPSSNAVAPNAGHPEPRTTSGSKDPVEVTSKEAPRDSSAPLGMTEIEESIFVFAKAPEQQIARVAKGGSSGAKIMFTVPRAGDKGALAVLLEGKTTPIDVAQNTGKEVAIPGSELSVRIENYWPDFRIQDGKPRTLSDAPNNPAVVVTIHGRAVPVAAAPANHGANAESASATSGAPPMLNPADAAQNHLTLFLADDGTISYELKSRKQGTSSGVLKLNEPLPTGWADWQLVVDREMQHAEPWMDFLPVATEKPAQELPDGVRVRVQQNGKSFEQWVPAGWQIAIPTSPDPITIEYGWRVLALPISLDLLDFEVTRNEGSDAPAGFKSTLRVATPEGASATGQCYMNHPFSFPSAWWRTWTGLTFKISQASWNPENLSQSTVQILRDPGWSLKWIGSLLIVTGVFLMFYVKKFRRATVDAPSKAKAAEPVLA
ncbi:MAG: cytochrome c biogenesis protein ResB, partial [Verrucomicrobiota bacterium]|nr:cytochrome c biogenesis protein ResB [Verrucomicrobiota bacterium]